MTTMTDRAFWLDRDYDQDNADTGTPSRYGNYLNQYHHAEFAHLGGYEDPTVLFAVAAWKVATGPVMAPALVRRRPRVLSATVAHDDWEGGLIATVELITGRPEELRHVTTGAGDYIRDWRYDSYLERYDDGVTGEALAAGTVFLTSVATVVWQIPPGAIPTITQIPAPGPQLHKMAVWAVDGIATAMDRQIQPLIDRMDS